MTPSGVSQLQSQQRAEEKSLARDDWQGYADRLGASRLKILDTIDKRLAVDDSLAALAEAHIGTDRDDFVGAIHEAERQIRVAERGILRAIKTA